MANSQVTYTVFDSDCMMLSDLELSDSTVLRFDEDGSDGEEEEEEEEDAFRQQKRMILMMEGGMGERKRTFVSGSLDRSVVLDGPTLNLALPVIESNKMRPEEGEGEEETPTPMVEMRRTDDFRKEREEDRLNRNHLRLEFPTSGEPTMSGHLPEKTATIERKSDPVPQQQQNENNNNNSTNGVGTGRTEHRRAEDGLSVSQQQQQQHNNSNRSVAERWEGRRQRGEETHQQQRKETPKRPSRASPTQAGREEKKAPLFVPPSNPMRAKCKAPTKSQIIMDQLKASIEAEKQRAKKKREEEKRKREEEERGKREEKERKKKEEERKKKEEEMKKKEQEKGKREEEKEKKKGSTDEERKEINEKLPSGDFSNLTVMEQTNPKMKEVKSKRSVQTQSSQPRQLLSRVTSTAQNSTNAPSQVGIKRSNSRLTSSVRPVLSSRENTSIALKGISPSLGMTRRSMTAKSQSVEHVSNAQKELSGIIRATANGRGNESKNANLSDRQRSEMEHELRQRLKHNTKTLDVFIVMAAHFASTKETVQSELEAQHKRAIAELESNSKKRLREKEEQHRVEIDELRAKFSSEHSENITKLRGQQQEAVNELEKKYARELKEKLAEQEEKHRMEMAESTTLSTERLQMELESRNYELQIKNEELSKLRQADREKQFEVDKLRENETQIVKLKAQNDDLRVDVNRFKSLEKQLNANYEKVQRELNETHVKLCAVVKENEVLKYQLSGGEESDCPQFLTPRTRKSVGTPSIDAAISSSKGFKTPETQRRRISQVSAPCHQQTNWESKTPQFDMSRSVDSSMTGRTLIACYIQEGMSKAQNTPTKIYTPRGVEVVPASSNGRRTVNFDSTRGENGELSTSEKNVENGEEPNPPP